MTSGSRINIVSSTPREFSTNITVNNVIYHVQTEDTGVKTCKIVSRVYRQGEVVFTKKSDYAHLLKLKEPEIKIRSLLEGQHKATIDAFLKEHSVTEKGITEYLEEIKQHLRKGSGKSALESVRLALEKFPSDLFLFSYYGYLTATVEKNPKEGTRICREAITRLESSVPFGSDFFYPLFYLNLGKAYLAANRKRDAITAFNEGLRNDPENHDLLWELKKLGTRRKVSLPFIGRNNPINKYIGMLLHKISG
jgi:tetratricopeptide (TPR) repeat protein